MKCLFSHSKNILTLSLPMRGAWIEMHLALRFSHHWQCRSPCGERGLKSPRKCLVCGKELSLPMRGAWIEIRIALVLLWASCRSPCGERGFKIRGSCQATITGNVLGWQMVHLWCYSLSYCDWRKVCGSIFKKTR